MLRSVIGLTDKLFADELSLDELTPLELTWITRYAYAQYFYWQTSDRPTAAHYYHIADEAASKLVKMIEAVQP